MKMICIGKIVNTHGLKGEVKIQSYSDFDSVRYQKGNTIYINSGDEYLPFMVETYRNHKNHSLVSFQDHQDINAIEKYKNCEVYISSQDRKPLENDYYQDEIIGCLAQDEQGNSLGKIIAFEATNGAQNNIRIQNDAGKEFLVPFLPIFIQSVDLDHQLVTIHRMEGLECE